jgi:hypothetical protein
MIRRHAHLLIASALDTQAYFPYVASPRGRYSILRFFHGFTRMVIIDAHIHFSRIACFQEAALTESGCDYSLAGILNGRWRPWLRILIL